MQFIKNYIKTTKPVYQCAYYTRVKISSLRDVYNYLGKNSGHKPNNK